MRLTRLSQQLVKDKRPLNDASTLQDLLKDNLGSKTREELNHSKILYDNIKSHGSATHFKDSEKFAKRIGRNAPSMPNLMGVTDESKQRRLSSYGDAYNQTNNQRLGLIQRQIPKMSKKNLQH